MTKRKRETTEKMMRRVLKDTNNITVADCEFKGVAFDKAAVDAMSIIAEGLLENARALSVNADALKQLSYVLKASNVTIETMLKF